MYWASQKSNRVSNVSDGIQAFEELEEEEVVGKIYVDPYICTSQMLGMWKMLGFNNVFILSMKQNIFTLCKHCRAGLKMVLQSLL